LALGACTRTYDAAPPRVVTHPAINMAAYRMAIAWVPTVEVRLQSSALEGTVLRGAKLAPLSSDPCSAGVDFDRIEADGIERLEGPLDLRGNHDLDVSFYKAGSIVTEPSAVDLELDTPTGRSCTRVPLRGAESPDWTVHRDSSPGLSISVGTRGFPISTTSTVGVEPLWFLDERLGAAFGPYRIWTEFAGGPGRTTGYGDIVLAIGADRAVVEAGRFAFMLGAGYEVVWNVYKAPGEERSSQRYAFHGPRVTPSFSYTFLNDLPRIGLPAGRRTFYAELEMPTSVWFGTGDAPHTTLVPGLGLSLFYAF
jgi:hypothetical protein